jgi:hypothetical protein
LQQGIKATTLIGWSPLKEEKTKGWPKPLFDRVALVFKLF